MKSHLPLWGSLAVAATLALSLPPSLARAADEDAAKMLARQSGSATAVEQLHTRSGVRRMVLTSARPQDELQVQVLRLRQLADQARARDAQVHKLAETAKPAGDANPYKEPRKIDSDEE